MFSDDEEIMRLREELAVLNNAHSLLLLGIHGLYKHALSNQNGVIWGAVPNPPVEVSGYKTKEECTMAGWRAGCGHIADYIENTFLRTSNQELLPKFQELVREPHPYQEPAFSLVSIHSHELRVM
jgi:hypothetical protein